MSFGNKGDEEFRMGRRKSGGKADRRHGYNKYNRIVPLREEGKEVDYSGFTCSAE
jgi:hypothetical protein